jgi:HEPN domain-containing protein
MATRSQLRSLALLRRQEAQALFDAGLYDGAHYLAGYVLEFALKARICRVLDLDEYPDSGDLRRSYATHDLAQLLKLSGLSRRPALQEAELFVSWSTAARWKPEIRYDTPGLMTREDVSYILRAIDEVLRWIRRHW